MVTLDPDPRARLAGAHEISEEIAQILVRLAMRRSQQAQDVRGTTSLEEIKTQECGNTPGLVQKEGMSFPCKH